jgi:hypothetical protein
MIDVREFCESGSVRLWFAFAVCPKGLDSNVQANPVPVLETVSDAFLWRVNSYGNIIDRNDLNARAKDESGYQNTRRGRPSTFGTCA